MNAKTKVYSHELPIKGIHDGLYGVVFKAVASYERHNLARATIYRARETADGLKLEVKRKANRLYSPVQRRPFKSLEEVKSWVENAFHISSPEYTAELNRDLGERIKKMRPWHEIKAEMDRDDAEEASRAKVARPKTIRGKTMEEYISWLESTLIPDLKESGQFGCAQDYETCIKWMRYLSEKGR